MLDPVNILLGILLFAAIVSAVIVGICMLSVYMLPKAEIKPLDEQAQEKLRAMSESQLGQDFLEINGFVWDGAYRMNSILGSTDIAAWQQAGSPTYAVVYVLQNKQTAIDIVSIFSTEPDFGLTTGTSRDGHLFPHRPGSYVQTFSQSDAHKLWQHHTDAEALLSQLDLIELHEHNLPLNELMMYAIREQMAHVRTIPLWPVRALWRYFVTRYKLHNKTIEQQLSKPSHFI